MKTKAAQRAFLVLLCLTACGHVSAAEKQVLKYHDGKPDGRKSLGGSGEMIAFAAPAGPWVIKAVRIHGSRYGMPEAPKEDFYVFLTDAAGAQVLHTETAPYKLFERGEAKWVEVRLKKPVKAPEKFQVAVDFKAQQTKGVYVSYDTSSGGKSSKAGLPGGDARATDFGGDWMIEVVLEKP